MKTTKNNSSLEAAEKIVQKAIEEKDAFLDSAETVKNGYLAKIASAEKEMTEASGSGNFDGFKEAKMKSDFYNKTLAIHTQKQKEMSEYSLIDAETYRSTVSAILNEYSEMECAAREKAAEMLKQLDQMAADLDTYVLRANAVMATLYQDVYRCPDISQDEKKNDTLFNIALKRETPTCKESPIVPVVAAIHTKALAYQNITGKEVAVQKRSSF